MARIDVVLNSGRRVSLEQLHIERSGLGLLGGQARAVREHVLNDLPQRAKQLFGRESGLVVKPPAAQELPTYLVLADLMSHQAVRTGDLSSLVVAWFQHHLPTHQDVSAWVQDVDWDTVAVDGCW